MSDLLNLRGVGDNAVKLLNKLGIENTLDLIQNIPRKYDDYSILSSVAKIKPGRVTIKIKLRAVKSRYSAKGLHITEALASDESGSVRVLWFNQPYRANSIKADAEYYLSGDFAQNYKFLCITNPTCELVSSFPLHTARLVPQYKLTKGISSSQLRKFTKTAFEVKDVKETLPKWLIDDKKFISRRQALFSMHFPEKIEMVSEAKRRIGFEELFQISLASELNKIETAKEKSLNIPFNKAVVVKFVQSLPYKLTDDQRKVSWQILQDMTSGSPMNRLLQGDVGSGKTVVATIALVNVATSGFQAVLMAPTELLAKQHLRTINEIIPSSLKKEVVFLSSSLTNQQKINAYEQIATNKAKIVIGTHSLIQSKVEFKNLALLIIDEQHRFGVEQRKLLQAKAVTMPHVLNMSATPIPRSLMLTLYGEMDSSIIIQMPAGRKKTETSVVQPEQRRILYEGLRVEIDKGNQIFVVCPQIEESIKQGRTLSVESIHKQLKSWLKMHKIGLLHGKLKADEKDEIMQDFIDKKYDLLVSTTVIEVGVDVPNAAIMVVEGADRFGLAQLHQLRGRVGRGNEEGKCYLILSENGGINKRLQVLEKESNGFKLAEYDLELRGPGAIYGSTQHGALDLRVAKITDVKLIEEARIAARQFIHKSENMLKYPELKARVESLRIITNLN